MYVCICNAVSEADVHGCVAKGACSTRQVKQACGWKPGCGSCTRRLAEVFGQATAATADAPKAPAPVQALEVVAEQAVSTAA